MTRQWVAAVRAEAHAASGNESACLRDLTAAEAVMAKAERGTRSGWLRFDGARLPEVRGSCLVALGHYDAAEEALRKSLASAATARRRSAVLCDLAVVGVRLQDVDRVVDRLVEVLENARSTGSAVIRGRLRAVRPELTPLLKDRRVLSIDEQIRGLHVLDRIETGVKKEWR